MTKRNRQMSRLPLMVVLLINMAVTGVGWAMAAPAAAPVQHVAAHSHCGEAMEQGADVDDSPAAQTVPQHQHAISYGCCTPGTCHCASPTPTSEMAVVPVRAALVRVASIAARNQGAVPAPALVRLFRPPIA